MDLKRNSYLAKVEEPESITGIKEGSPEFALDLIKELICINGLMRFPREVIVSYEV